MRNIVKALATGVLVVPVVVGGAGMAFADGDDHGRDYGHGRDYDNGRDYDKGRDYGDGPAYIKVTNSATVWGGKESKTVSGFREDGTAFFYKSHKVADHKGAYGHKVGARS